MRDKGGGASSAITVSSRELVVRGAVGASLRVVRRRGAEVNLDEVVGDVERLAVGFPRVCVYPGYRNETCKTPVLTATANS